MSKKPKATAEAEVEFDRRGAVVMNSPYWGGYNDDGTEMPYDDFLARKEERDALQDAVFEVESYDDLPAEARATWDRAWAAAERLDELQAEGYSRFLQAGSDGDVGTLVDPPDAHTSSALAVLLPTDDEGFPLSVEDRPCDDHISNWQPLASVFVSKSPSKVSKSGVTASVDRLPRAVGVWRDWDALEAVVLGIPDSDVLPAWYPDWEDPDNNEVEDPGAAGQTKAGYDPDMYGRAVEQCDYLSRHLERNGVQVYRPPAAPLELGTSDPVGYTGQYCREQFTVIGRNIVVNQTRVPHRRKELLGLMPFLEAMCRKFPHLRLLVPPDAGPEKNDDWENDPRCFVEGGDIYRFGRDVVVGMSFLTTSGAGFRWLADSLADDGFELWPAYLKHEWFHTDYIFDPVREGLCIAHLDGFVDGLLPSPITDWEVIGVTKREADEGYVCNGMRLGPDTYLLPTDSDRTSTGAAASRRVARALERKGINAVEIPFDGVYFWGGAIRCATTDLFRRGKAPRGVETGITPRTDGTD